MDKKALLNDLNDLNFTIRDVKGNIINSDYVSDNDFLSLVANQAILSQALIEKYKDALDFDVLFLSGNYSEQTVDKYSDRIKDLYTWREITEIITLSPNFILTHYNKLDMSNIIKFQSRIKPLISQDFWKNNFNWTQLYKSQYFYRYFTKEYPYLFNQNDLLEIADFDAIVEEFRLKVYNKLADNIDRRDLFRKFIQIPKEIQNNLNFHTWTEENKILWNPLSVISP